MVERRGLVGSFCRNFSFDECIIGDGVRSSLDRCGIDGIELGGVVRVRRSQAGEKIDDDIVDRVGVCVCRLGIAVVWRTRIRSKLRNALDLAKDLRLNLNRRPRTCVNVAAYTRLGFVVEDVLTRDRIVCSHLVVRRHIDLSTIDMVGGCHVLACNHHRHGACRRLQIHVFIGLPERLHLRNHVDRNQPRLDLFASWGVTPCATATELAKKCDVIFIAVKPYGVAAVLEEMRPALSKDTLVVSIAAGVTIATMEAAAGEGVPIIRVMPNTPCLVKCVAAAMSAGRYCDQTHADTVSTLFDAVGKIHQVKESLLNAVTGVSGSGPAYVFQVIEAMADGGVLAGLPRGVAQDLGRGQLSRQPSRLCRRRLLQLCQM